MSDTKERTEHRIDPRLIITSFLMWLTWGTVIGIVVRFFPTSTVREQFAAGAVVTAALQILFMTIAFDSGDGSSGNLPPASILLIGASTETLSISIGVGILNQNWAVLGAAVVIPALYLFDIVRHSLKLEA